MFSITCMVYQSCAFALYFLQMSLVFANQLSSSLPRLSFTLPVLAGLFHWTASQRLQSHVVSCDGTGLSVMLHSIDETFYRGAPYVQGKPRLIGYYNVNYQLKLRNNLLKTDIAEHFYGVAFNPVLSPFSSLSVKFVTPCYLPFALTLLQVLAVTPTAARTATRGSAKMSVTTSRGVFI